MYVDEEAASSFVSRSRREFVVDGIFAFAITLLLVDVHVPRNRNRHTITELVAELVRGLPASGSCLQ